MWLVDHYGSGAIGGVGESQLWVYWSPAAAQCGRLTRQSQPAGRSALSVGGAGHNVNAAERQQLFPFGVECFVVLKDQFD